MRQVKVSAVWLEPSGEMHIRPDAGDFEYIYRAAMQVGWDAESRSLFSPPPRSWSHLDWFHQIQDAVRSEYGRVLVVDADTTWDGVPNELREGIQASAQRTSA